ncbi:MAG TPA: SDR family NAD(P)-dependent oxidoreductase [Alphaproteobacteria bacterium]|nr:SDR family NAD(P)-dependent oxidoreductase [Alphaproteobacteria bacterium]
MSMRMDFTGKKVLVTGSTMGIGRGAANGFHELGATVAINGRKPDSVRKVIQEMGGGPRLVAAPGDLSKVSDCERLVTGAAKAMGGLDVLVNNAGRGDDMLIENATEGYWEMMLALNLKGAFFCAKYALPALRQSKGSIINVASMLGVTGGPDATTVYSATKGGMVQMTRMLALALAKDGIRVNSLCPGWIKTPMIEHENEVAGNNALYDYIEATAPLGRIGTVDECTGAILYLAWEKAGYTTGATLVNDGGISAGH